MHDGRRPRRHFERDRERIRLLQNRPGPRPNLELVLFTVGQIGNEDLPDAGRHQQPHRVHAAIPEVEVADDADAIRVRRPDREMHAGRGPDGDAVSAELFEHTEMRPLAEQMQIEIGQHAAVPVRVVDLDHVIARICDAKPVIGRAGWLGGVLRQADLFDPDLEQSRRVTLHHRHERASRDEPQIDRAPGGLERAHHDRAALLVRTDHREGVAMAAADEGGEGRIERGDFVALPDHARIQVPTCARSSLTG